jgi:hypothetical protein
LKEEGLRRKKASEGRRPQKEEGLRRKKASKGLRPQKAIILHEPVCLIRELGNSSLNSLELDLSP